MTVMGEYPVVGYRFEQFELDIKGHRLLQNGKPMALGHYGVGVLEKLIERQGKVAERDELLRLWPPHRSEGILEQVIRKVRRALGDKGGGPGKQHKYVQTVYGRGYSFSSAITITPVYENPNNLPHQIKKIKGRNTEVEEIKKAIAESRLLTLAGAPGIGKTRLAIEVAAQVLSEYRDGVWWVDLTRISDEALLPKTVAETFGLTEGPARPIIDALSNTLRAKRLLLLLDNCEHMIEACASLVSTLLQAAHELRVLVTSREPLDVPGEVVWNVPPLPYPEPERPKIVKDLESYEAVQLFVAEARLRKPKFFLSQKSGPVVAEICRQLDGLPLALELAATWLDSMSVEEILSELSNRLRLLQRGERGTSRHQTMRAAIDWSYEFLNDERLKALLRRLAVFAGGWTREAAEYVCASEGIEEQDVFILLTRLVRKSLIIAGDEGGKTRYRMLKTIQEYGLEKLEAAGEMQLLIKKHSNWFVIEIAERAVREVTGAERGEWLKRLDVEYDNIRAVLQNNLSGRGDVEAALRLCGALHRFWLTRGYIREARSWAGKALDMDAGASKEARAQALRTAGYFFGQFTTSGSDSERGRAFYAESLDLLREVDDRVGLARTLTEYSFLLDRQGDYEEGINAAREARNIFKDVHDQLGFAAATHNVALCLLDLDDHVQAVPLFQESLRMGQGVGDKLLPALCLHNLAELSIHLNNIGEATRLLKECGSLFKELGHLPLIERTNILLGEVDRARGDYKGALARHKSALSTLQEISDMAGILTALEALACTEAVSGHSRRALQLAGWTSGVRDSIKLPLSPAQKNWIDRYINQVADNLGEDTANEAHSEGRGMHLERILEFALK